MEVRELLEYGKNLLTNIEYSDSYKEARYILSEILQVDITYLLTYPHKNIDEDNSLRYKEILNRRLQGEPLQYILGKCEFMGLEIEVEEGVLIPRADTEISCETILSLSHILGEELDILEIGTGSGAVSVSLGKYLPKSSIDGVDISPKAIKVSHRNIEKHRLSNVNIFYSDLFSDIIKSYDIIYSNPPYIPSEDIETLQVEVRDFEPRLALDGGTSGLDFYKKISEQARDFLKWGGYLIYEIGYDQANSVSEILRDNLYSVVNVVKDLSGHDRVIVAKID